MWIYLTLFRAIIISASANEFMNLVNEREFSVQDHKLLKQIVPGYSSQGYGDNDDINFFSIFSEDNQKANIFYKYVEKGVTTKGLTFNIYDDDIRNATIALFRLLRDIDQTNEATYDKLKKWARNTINNDILDYALRLSSLFSNSHRKESFLPPYIVKPNFFVSGDTIMKAFYFRVNNGKINEDLNSVYQILKLDENNVAINTNYSLCLIPFEQCIAQVKYFTEDVALNSYYYGLHLLHPFWMSDDELNELNPSHAAHYYFTHQQLYARYLLEKEHIDENARTFQVDVEPDFQAGLFYENGLSFPIRTSTLGRKIRKDVTDLQKIDLAITECIERGIVKAENGTIQVNEDNYMDLLAKFVRSQIESTKAVKVIRSVFGYASNGYPVDKYNPAPSVMHHPQTALRDPVYWYLIKRVVDYFLFYTNSTKNYDLSKYVTSDFMITDLKVPRISTTYKYFLINLHNSLTGDRSIHTNTATAYNIFSRQKRLNHVPFELIFTVKSITQKNVTIKLFLGPQCSISNCWEMHFRFFQLDSYRHSLNKGSNIITWSPDLSKSYSSDEYYNKSLKFNNIDVTYDVYKFPKNLVIPKGREDGLNLTMFIMILDEDQNFDVSKPSLYENRIKTLGFPFHKQADKNTLSDNAPNYRLFNITVFHIKESPDGAGYFSSYLY